MLDLSEEELMNIMSRRPQVKARKAMDVLIKWEKKKLALEAPKIENTEESGKEAYCPLSLLFSGRWAGLNYAQRLFQSTETYLGHSYTILEEWCRGVP